jgi:aryl-alcohol dehydrogenase-like predicted oxidoreductase
MLAGMSGEMAYGQLGRSGLLVSRIGLATMNFGYTADEATSFAVMDVAIDAGITFFDTADVYGGPSAASARHFMGLVSEQSLYNLAVRAVEMELIPPLRHMGVGLIPYSPLHAGLLAGALQSAAGRRQSDDRIEAHRDRLDAYEGLCRDLGAEPAAVAVAWLLRNRSCPPPSSER